MAYEKVEIGIWKPEKENDSIEGIYISAEKDVGANKSNLYHLDVEGKPISIWGSAILDTKMVIVKPEDKVKIVYLGLGEAKAGKQAPKRFDVYIDKDQTKEVSTVDPFAQSAENILGEGKSII